MTGLKLLGLVWLAVFVVGVSVVSSASAALPQVLPETEGKMVAATSTSAVIFETTGGKKIACEKASGTSKEAGKTPLGEFHSNFEKCTTTVAGIKFTCTGLGDVSGNVLLLGEYHFVYDALGASETNALGIALLLLISQTHFECAGGFALVKVEGSEMCLVTEPHVAKTLHAVSCKISTTAGVPEDKVYWNDEGKEVKHGSPPAAGEWGMIMSENEGTAIGSAEGGSGLILWLNAAKENVSASIMG